MRLERFYDASCQAVKHFLFLPNPLFTYKQAHTQIRNKHSHYTQNTCPVNPGHRSCIHTLLIQCWWGIQSRWDYWPFADTLTLCDLVRERKRAVFSYICFSATTTQRSRIPGILETQLNVTSHMFCQRKPRKKLEMLLIQLYYTFD